MEDLRENIGVVVVHRHPSNYNMSIFVLFNFLVYCFAIGLGLFLDELILVVIGLVAMMCFIGILEESPQTGSYSHLH